MEDNLSKGKYFGQILAICVLGVIMLLFKLVQPLSGIVQTLPDAWNEFATLMIYALIEFVLIILICCHFIFGQTFKALGINGIKKNIGLFVINALYIGGCVGMTYFTAQMSKSIDFDGLKIGLTVAGNLVAVAFIKEVIFRGFLFRSFDKLFGNKGFGTGVLASIVVSILFACTFVPDTIMNLSNVSTEAFLQAMIWPIALSFYLGILFYLTDNLWVCVNIHWVCMSLAGLSADFFSAIFYGIYVVAMAIYLIYSLMKYIRTEGADEEITEEESESDNDAIEQVGTIEEMVEEVVKVSRPELEPINEIEPEIKDDIAIEQNEEPVEIPYFKEMMAQETTSMPAVEEVDVEKTTIIPAIHEEEDTSDPFAKKTIDLEETTVIPAICEEEEIVRSSGAIKVDFEKTMIMPAITEEEIEKARTEKEKDKHEIKDFEETVVMPAITTEEEDDLSNTAIITNVKEELSDSKVIPFQARGGIKENVDALVKDGSEIESPQMKVKAEPNYIAHLEKYLGEFEGIFRQMTPTDPPIDIMFFKGERYNALVTNGMRSMPMALPPELGNYQQLELMMFLDKSIEVNDSNIENEENAWLIKLLIDLALFPKATGSYMGVGHIVGNGEALEPYCTSSDYCGALIFPPMEQENVKFYRYVEKGNTIYIHNVMPLFREELRFIQEHSADQFINLMSEVGVRQIVKRQRVNVIKAFNDEK